MTGAPHREATGDVDRRAGRLAADSGPPGRLRQGRTHLDTHPCARCASKRSRDHRHRLPDPAVGAPAGGRRRLRGLPPAPPRPEHPAVPALHARRGGPHRLLPPRPARHPGAPGPRGDRLPGLLVLRGALARRGASPRFCGPTASPRARSGWPRPVIDCPAATRSSPWPSRSRRHSPRTSSPCTWRGERSTSGPPKPATAAWPRGPSTPC